MRKRIAIKQKDEMVELSRWNERENLWHRNMQWKWIGKWHSLLDIAFTTLHYFSMHTRTNTHTHFTYETNLSKHTLTRLPCNSDRVQSVLETMSNMHWNDLSKKPTLYNTLVSYFIISLLEKLFSAFRYGWISFCVATFSVCLTVFLAFSIWNRAKLWKCFDAISGLSHPSTNAQNGLAAWSRALFVVSNSKVQSRDNNMPFGWWIDVTDQYNMRVCVCVAHRVYIVKEIKRRLQVKIYRLIKYWVLRYISYNYNNNNNNNDDDKERGWLHSLSLSFDLENNFATIIHTLSLDIDDRC